MRVLAYFEVESAGAIHESAPTTRHAKGRMLSQASAPLKR